MLEWIATGLSLGFIGSIQCVGMCGPIALMLPGRGAARWRFVGGRLLYNVGRATTYAALGALFGAVGLLAALGGWQQVLSFIVGVLLVGAAFVPWLQRRLTGFEAVTARGLRGVVASIQALYRRGGTASLFAIGLLNGLLPCGLVYAAVATSVTAGSVGGSAAFMGAFGLGTIPAMFAVALAGGLAQGVWRVRLARLVPLELALLGVLLILRSLSLGFLLSPDLREALFTPGVCRFIPLVEPA